MGTTLKRRAVLAALSLPFLVALGLDLAAQGKPGGGGGPPPNPAIAFRETTSKNILLRVMNADGSNVRTVVTGGKYDGIWKSSWSPSGSRLTFGGRLGATQGLWVVNLDGTGRQCIVPFPAGASFPARSADWSPAVTADGLQKIAFLADSSVPDYADVYVVNPDGSGLQMLAFAADVLVLCWNYDASALLGANVGPDLVKMQLAAAPGGGLMVSGETWLPVTGNNAMLNSANATDRIVCEEFFPPGDGLRVIDLRTSPPLVTQVTFAGESWPSFSPDDGKLAYMRSYSIYTCNADGTGETLIRNGSSGPYTCNMPIWRRN